MKQKDDSVEALENDLENELIRGVDIENADKAKNNDRKNIIGLPVNNKLVRDAVRQNEDGDAHLLIKCLQNRYCFDHAAQEWYYWNDHFWRLDKINHVTVMVKEIIDLYGNQKIFEILSLKQAESEQDEKQIATHKFYIKLLDERIQALQTAKRKKTVLTLAASGLNSLGVTGEDWDKHPMLFGCRNGCIDLEKGQFKPGQPADYIKTASPIKWIKYDEPCPIWEKFLSEMFSQDQDLVDYLQRLLGYGITGLNTEHIFPIFWGQSGRNGKGTLFETLKYILGEYAYKVKANFLMEQNVKGAGGPDAVTMGLLGKRLVWCSETNEKDRLDVAQLKELVGGDTLHARLPYAKRPVEFQPTHLLLTITNRCPKVPANDMPLWRRIHLIPLKNSFIDDPNPNNPTEFKADKTLSVKLKQEASGILAWLVRGCLLYQRDGLKHPDIVDSATAAYRENEDVIGDFLHEMCIEAESVSLKVKFKDLYIAYKKWCEEVGHFPMAKKRFVEDVGTRYEKVTIHGFPYFIKIGLLEGL